MKSEMVTYSVPNSKELISTGEGVLAWAKYIVVDSAAAYQGAGVDLKEIKSQITRLENGRLGITRPLDAAKKAVMDLFRQPVDLLKEASSAIETKMLAFSNEQERLRREQERAVAEAIAAEAARQEEELKAARAQAETVEELEGATIVARESAAALASVADTMMAQVVAPAAARGVSQRGTWKAQCVDLLALVKFVAANPEYLEVLEVNLAALNRVAREQERQFNLAGCEATFSQSIVSR